MRSPAPSSADRDAADRALAPRVPTSPTLARLWRERIAPEADDTEGDSLAAWARVLNTCVGAGDWRAERLAQALLAGGIGPLRLFPGELLGRWFAVARHLHPVLDEALVPAALPRAVASWSVGERRRWLASVLALPPPAALVLYRQLPPQLTALDPPHRLRVLSVLGRLAAAPADDLEAVVPLAPVALLALPLPARSTALELLERVSSGFPDGAPAFLGNLPRLFDEAPAHRIAEWVDRGLAIAGRHREAGCAFFALASRTSLRLLRTGGTAVTLDELQGVLRRVVHMLSGTPAVPRPAVHGHLRPPLEDAPADGGVAFPPAVDICETWEENARFFRAYAALLAGRRLHGTYEAAVPLTASLRAPQEPTALEDCFLLADGVRLAHAVGREYPGLAADLRWAASRLLAAADERPLTVFDFLLARALAGRSRPPAAPWLERTAALVLPSLEPLALPGTSGVQALTVARRLAALFPESAAGTGPDAVPALATLLLEADGGAGDAQPVGSMGLGRENGGDGSGAAALPPDLLERLALLLEDHVRAGLEGGAGLSAEALQRLVERALETTVGQSRGTVAAQAGLFVTQLLGKRLADGLLVSARPASRAPAPRRLAGTDRGGATFRYDEWDYRIADYRPAWCAVRELSLRGDSGVYFDRALERHAALVPEVRRQFQRVRPELYRRTRGLEDGEEVELGAVVDARAQRRARQPASPKLYSTRVRHDREVATLFLLDMSASTDETAPRAADRIIDIAKDALVIMAAALEELGDQYAIYGFSGQGREQVEVYPIKTFAERLGPAVRGRLGGIEPRGSTRMGAAIRHALRVMRGLTASARHLILLSDGFPQDLDYGNDRQSHVYGIRDTAVALREVATAGIRPFCITVDLAGHDYLREMCDPRQYLVIEEVAALPRELPKIYRRVVRPD